MTKDEYIRQVTQNKAKMYRIAFTILKNDADVQDALQEAALKAWEKQHTLKNEAFIFFVDDPHPHHRKLSAAPEEKAGELYGTFARAFHIYPQDRWLVGSLKAMVQAMVSGWKIDLRELDLIKQKRVFYTKTTARAICAGGRSSSFFIAG